MWKMKTLTILFIVLCLGTYSSKTNSKFSTATIKTKYFKHIKAKTSSTNLSFSNLKDSLDLVVNKKIIAIEKINRAIVEQQKITINGKESKY